MIVATWMGDDGYGAVCTCLLLFPADIFEMVNATNWLPIYMVRFQ